MISRFCRYVDKVFKFGDQLCCLKDSRSSPQIPTAAVWASAFAMFLTGRKTLNALESDLRVPKRLDGLIGPRKPSADTIGRVLGRMDPEPLRQILSRINHLLGRNKALPLRWPIRVAAVDGHEFFSQ
jgi:hypothetical protein